MIRLTIPSIEEDDLRAVREALASGFLVQGKRVDAFEHAMADYLGTKHAVAVSNCTAALHLSLLAIGVHRDDLVLVTTYSWIATANVIELCGAKPVFIDIQPDTFNMDPEILSITLKELMSDKDTARRVKAILPVHTFGQMADLSEITRIAAPYQLPVIEDAACALGARWNSQQAGTWGKMGCFSFHPRKAITTGEGGIIATDDPDLTKGLKSLRSHGQDFNAETIDFCQPGFNYRMTEFQASLGTTQLAKLDRIIAARRRLAAHYDHLLSGSPLRTPFVPPASRPVYQSYVVLLPESAAGRRNELIIWLKEQGIETTIGTCHMPLTTFFRNKYNFHAGDFPVTDQVFQRSLTLPLHEFLTPIEQQTVADKIMEWLNQAERL